MSYKTDNISLVRVNSDVDAYDSGEINTLEHLSYANLFYPFLWDNGGNSTTASLTIDILNKNELKINGFPNEKWHNKLRQRGNLIDTQPIWGFKETSNPSKISPAISNAFCFADQQLTFHIATEGHGMGHIEDQWLYCKTTLTISTMNVLNGDTSTIKTFNQFETQLDDSSRYFNWTVPAQSITDFTSYGLFGMIVVRMEIENSYYYDARFENPYIGDYPNKNASLLHLLTYSAGKELYDVTDGGLTILETPVTEFEELEDIFAKTIFDDLTDLNQNDITDDQKRAIVADQIAVVFMSQHPVVTADYYPSKILGYGMTEGIQTETVLKKASTYSERYPETYSLARDRLFGMITSVEKFNFVKEFETLFPNYYQSTQMLRDPARILLTQSDGLLSDDIGVDGILFNPYVIDVTSTDIIFDVQSQNEMTFPIPIAQGTVGIGNIEINNNNGESLQSGDMLVEVSFDVLFGENDISRIRYSLWTKNSLNHLEHVDLEGLSRNYTFSLDSNNPIKDEDIIHVRIDVEDASQVVNSFYAEKLIPDTLNVHGITVLSASQRQDGSGFVDIYYDYFGRSEINASYVRVSLSHNGINFISITEGLMGDVGFNVMPGRNRIVWNPYSLYEDNFPSSVIIKLTIVDADLGIGVGISSNMSVLDLYAPEVAVRKVNADEEYDMWHSSSSSSSDSSDSSSSSSSLGESSSSSSYDYSSSSSSLYDNNILLWKMDDTLWDGSAGDVKDTTVYGYDGTSEGGAITVVDAEFDRAGYFDRDLVNEPLASLDITSNPISNLSVGTISLWVNPESTVVGNSFRSLVMFKFDSNNYYGFDIRHGGGDDLKFGVSMYIDSLSIPITKCLSTNVVTEGSWNHVVLVQDGLEIKLYLNGVEEIVNWTPNDTYKNVFLANLSPILMSVGGSSFGNAEVVGGNIANFEIYDEALTEEAIQRIYDRKA